MAVIRRWDGTSWVDIATGVVGPHSHTTNLDELNDVTVTNPVTGNVIRWSGTEWNNAVLAMSDVSGLVSALAGKADSAHTHAAPSNMVTTDTTQTITSEKTFSGGLRLGNANLFLRGSGDNNHFMVYASGVDGPRLAGYSGGELGRMATGSFVQCLKWDSGGVDVTLGTLKQGGTAVVLTNDSRLSDARTPTAHDHDVIVPKSADFRAANALPSTYPVGITTFSASNAGWPEDYGTVTTSYVNIHRAYQVYAAKMSGKTWTRTADNDVWTAWRETSAAGHTHGVTDLTATGTRDVTTFLRGDNTWAVPAGGSGDALADVQTDPPASPQVGQLWLDTDEVAAGWNGALVITLGASDPVPTNLPVGTVIVRRNT